MNIATSWGVSAGLYGAEDLLKGAILDLASNIIAGSDGRVVKWTDESVYAQHAVPIPGVLAPPVATDLTPWGKKYIQGDGSAQGLYIPNFYIPPNCKDLTVFMSVRADGGGSASTHYLELTPKYDDVTTAFLLRRTAAFASGIKGNVGASSHSYGIGHSNWQSVSAEMFKGRTPYEVQIYRDGGLSPNTPASTQNTNTFQGGAPLYIGCRAGTSFFLRDNISRFIIFPFRVEGGRAMAITKTFINPQLP